MCSFIQSGRRFGWNYVGRKEWKDYYEVMHGKMESNDAKVQKSLRLSRQIPEAALPDFQLPRQDLSRIHLPHFRCNSLHENTKISFTPGTYTSRDLGLNAPCAFCYLRSGVHKCIECQRWWVWQQECLERQATGKYLIWYHSDDGYIWNVRCPETICAAKRLLDG